MSRTISELWDEVYKAEAKADSFRASAPAVASYLDGIATRMRRNVIRLEVQYELNEERLEQLEAVRDELKEPIQ